MGFVAILWAINALAFVVAVVRGAKNARQNIFSSSQDFKMKSFNRIEKEIDNDLAEKVVGENRGLKITLFFIVLVITSGYLLGSGLVIANPIFWGLSVAIFLVDIWGLFKNRERMRQFLRGNTTSVKESTPYKITLQRVLLLVHLFYFGNFMFTGNSPFELLFQ